MLKVFVFHTKHWKWATTGLLLLLKEMSGGNCTWVGVSRKQEGKKINLSLLRKKLHWMISHAIMEISNLWLGRMKTCSIFYIGDGVIYLWDPAHQELPERAQPPSVQRPPVPLQSRLYPEGGDVIRRPGQRAIGPETRRYKTPVRNSKNELVDVM